jgi:hypothetical protein
VRTLLTSLTLTLILGASSLAQDSTSDTPPPAKEPIIQDNSFLVEEAYNQNFGVVQHIQTFLRQWISHDWAYSFTQEWPVDVAPRNQLSYTIPVVHSRVGSGIGDLALNYRYQLIGDGDAKYALAPRVSVFLPTGDSRRGFGAGGTGVQLEIPFSVVHNKKWTTHWDVGTTLTPSQKNPFGDSASTYGVNAAQSFIYAVNNRFNLMLETVWASTESVIAKDKTTRDNTILMSPGVRWAYNFKSGMQIVPGVAFPIGVGPSAGDWGVLLYFSIEHPYRKLKPTNATDEHGSKELKK